MKYLTLLLAAALLSACGTAAPRASAPENAPVAVNVMWPGGRCDRLIVHTTGSLDEPKIERVTVEQGACVGPK